MTTDYQLLNQIDELVASKTFNLDALDGIKKLKDDLKQTLDERDKLQARYDGLYETNSKQSEEIQRLTRLLGEQTQKVAEMQDAAKKGYDAVWEKKIAEASAHAYRDAMAMVFKPNAVRESVQRNHSVWVPNPGGGGYAQSMVNQDNIVREDA